MNFSKIALSISVCFIFARCASPEEKVETPNFLFIVVDDLGFSDLGVNGSTYYETPHIDQLARMGVNFTRGYAASAVCSPSRASLLTGKFTASHQITDYIGAPEGEDWRKFNRFTPLLPASYSHFLPHEFVTFPEALKSKGYQTFFAGKWHLGGEENSSLPTDHGFDINQGGFHAGGPYTGGYFSPFNNPYLEDLEEEKGMSLSMKLAKETKQFIVENKEKPFLAYLAFYAVHAPIQTTQEKWQKYRDKAEEMGIQEEGFEMERILPIRKYQDNPVYAGLLEQVDEAVGSVMQTLKDQGLNKNTVVVFTSDNGGVASGDNYSTNSLSLRGGKGYQWEGGVKVPYMVYVPWMKQMGKTVDIPVSGVDFFPTILELAGVEAQQEGRMDGQSLVPLLEGEKSQERSLFWHYPHYGNQGGEPNSMVLKGNMKLIHYWEDERDELYDLSKDPGEKYDLSQEFPKQVEEMRGQLQAWLDETGAAKAVQDPLFDGDSLAWKLEQNRTVLLPRLEKQRREMLDKNWQPNADWWGSQK
ncbi:sulfatase [Algoriphagus vanfongensis]|uniref:sulfatase n=1 Tax=Algoriphagus vanfongensis TaxID=426371 RepID=UPI0004206D1F|nr:sulfatase [Algoriphagus vanfongensis]